MRVGPYRNSREAIVGADEDLNALGGVGERQQLQHLLLGFERLEQGADLLQFGERVDILKQVRLAAHDQRAALVAAGPSGPGGKPALDDPGGQLVQRRAVRIELGHDLVVGLVDGAADEAGAEEIRRLDQRRRAQALRRLDHPVFDDAGLGHQHHQRPAGREIHELDVAERALRLRRQHQAGSARQPRQRRHGVLEQPFQVFGRTRALHVDLAALGLGEVADLEDAVDEQAKPGLGRQPAGRGVRREQQPGLLQVRHDVADGGRRQVDVEPLRQRARADRLAGLEIGVDDVAQNLARAFVQFGNHRLSRSLPGRPAD